MPQDRTLAPEERAHRPRLPVYSVHLDFARGLAALVVLCGHLLLIVRGHTSAARAGQSSGALTHPSDAAGLGHCAVMVFFVLSGYLVGGSVLRDLRLNRFSWIKYFARRLTRLWIVLVPALLLGTVLDLATMHFFPQTRVVRFGQFTSNFAQRYPTPTNFFSHLFFLQLIPRFHIGTYGTNAALWSLSAEFWYYVLFPLIAFVLLSRTASSLQRVLLTGLTVGLLWFLGATITQSFLLWLLGVVAYLLPPSIPASVIRLANIVLLAQFLLVLMYVRAYALPEFGANLLIALSFMLLLYGLLHRTGQAPPSFYSRVAHTLSLPSYTLYAVHVPVCVFLAAAFEAHMPALAGRPATVAAILFAVVALYVGLLYLLFERNTARVLSWLLPPLVAFSERVVPRSETAGRPPCPVLLNFTQPLAARAFVGLRADSEVLLPVAVQAAREQTALSADRPPPEPSRQPSPTR